MSLPINAYDDLIDFILKGKTPEEVIAFKASPKINKRVKELIAREKANIITAEEKSEFENYMLLEHLMILAKARAHEKLLA